MMNRRFHILVTTPDFNKGKSICLLAQSEEIVLQLKKAYELEVEYVMLSGTKIKLRGADQIRVLKIKSKFERVSSEKLESDIRNDASILNRGVLNLRLLRLTSEDVTAEFIKPTFATEAHDGWNPICSDLRRVSEKKYKAGHYGDAVLSALKEVNEIVKLEYKRLTSKEDDGTSLMFQAFGSSTPQIRLTSMSSETERNVQDGYTKIFAGVMMGIRNPLAHSNIEMTRDEAWECILLANHLLRVYNRRMK